MSKTITLMATLAVALLCSTTASATTVKWTLSGVDFSGGHVLQGSFDYDADTVQYTNVAVQFDSGSVMTQVNSPSNANRLTAALPVVTQGSPDFYIYFSSPLTNSGGTISLAEADYGSCVNSGCTDVAAQGAFQVISVGSVTAPTPEPATMALSGIAGLAFIATRLRKRYVC